MFHGLLQVVVHVQGAGQKQAGLEVSGIQCQGLSEILLSIIEGAA